jgi:Na+-transporting methylmalonyl-CoA/oxaloacetate decarboxylase gamma subunit
VDAFAAVTFGVLAVLVTMVLLLGRFHPRTTREVLDWNPTRSAEAEVQNELEDIAQMLEATNERRRRRGLPDLTEEQMQTVVHDELAAQEQRRAELTAERDLREMLEATNAARRRRGEPELSEEQLRQETGWRGP